MGGPGSGNKNLSGKSGERSPESRARRAAAFRGTVALSKAIKRQLGEVDLEDPEKRTYAEVIAEKFVKLARGQGNGACSVKAVAEILDRTEGRPVQTVDMNLSTASREEQAAAILASLEAPKEDSEANESQERVN